MSEPICMECVRFYGHKRCEAFLGGIPREIWSSEVDHRLPFKGDGGLQFHQKAKQEAIIGNEMEDLDPIFHPDNQPREFVGPPPPWHSEKRNPKEQEHERELMHLWVNARLDEMLEPELLAAEAAIAAANKNHEGTRKWLSSERFAIEEAERGKPDRLRRLYPQFAHCIYSPELGQGHKHPRFPVLDRVQEAAEDVRRIRKIWLQVYGKQNRDENDKLRAEDIAAERWNIDVRSVRSRLNDMNRKLR